MEADNELDDLLTRVSVDPRVMGGMPVIRGTRVHVTLILNLLRHGYSVDRIVTAYPDLTALDVNAAIAYAEIRLKSDVDRTLNAS